MVQEPDDDMIPPPLNSWQPSSMSPWSGNWEQQGGSRTPRVQLLARWIREVEIGRRGCADGKLLGSLSLEQLNFGLACVSSNYKLY